MSESKIGYTTYQGRSEWYIRRWGKPIRVKKTFMEDGTTRLGIMTFAPGSDRSIKPHWIYATNGISERRMPCERRPHGDPSHRIELVACAREASDWVAELLIEMAHYPFHHRSGLNIGHTVPVTPRPGNLWDGYLLSWPLCEPDDFNPLAIDIGIEDWVFFAQVIGLKTDELDVAMRIGGPAFMKRVVVKNCGIDLSPLDVDRVSLLSGRRA